MPTVVCVSKRTRYLRIQFLRYREESTRTPLLSASAKIVNKGGYWAKQIMRRH
jgi:hypothetical protein